MPPEKVDNWALQSTAGVCELYPAAQQQSLYCAKEYCLAGVKSKEALKLSAADW
jgi:hypothetical protein